MNSVKLFSDIPAHPEQPPRKPHKRRSKEIDLASLTFKFICPRCRFPHD